MTITTSDDVLANVLAMRETSERKAWDSLSRYKFEMFGYWASSWVKYNALLPKADRLGNPFRDLVNVARSRGFGPGTYGLVSLYSVGSVLDAKTEMVYPANLDGTPDLENGTPLFGGGTSEEWFAALSEKDWNLVKEATK